MATAELIIDLADSVANMTRLGQLDSDDQKAWAIAFEWYGRSPAVQLVGKQNGFDGAWRESTLALLNIGAESARHPLSSRIESHAQSGHSRVFSQDNGETSLPHYKASDQG